MREDGQQHAWVIPTLRLTCIVAPHFTFVHGLGQQRCFSIAHWGPSASSTFLLLESIRSLRNAYNMYEDARQASSASCPSNEHAVQREASESGLGRFLDASSDRCHHHADMPALSRAASSPSHPMEPPRTTLFASAIPYPSHREPQLPSSTRMRLRFSRTGLQHPRQHRPTLALAVYSWTTRRAPDFACTRPHITYPHISFLLVMSCL